jgi:hypothetical protein
MSGGFNDMASLKAKADKLVGVAEAIKAKLAKKELDEDSEQMREIKQVMFNMGMEGNF